MLQFFDNDEPVHRHLFVCDCGDIEHQFVIDTINNKYEDNPEIYIQVHLSNNLCWYQRIWYGLLYIFGKQSKYGAFGEVILDHYDANRLIEVLSKNIKSTEEA